MRIVYTRADGGLSIVTPVESVELAMKDVPKDALNVRVVEDNEIPQDRTFRNAWVDRDGITHDMDKAREIHRNRLRQMRAPKFAPLDAAYMKADEAGNVSLKGVIAAQKQILRDVTADTAIEAAKDVEELKAAIPACLGD